MTDSLTEIDENLLRRAFKLAQQAREQGHRPFGTVVASAGGRILAEGGSGGSSTRVLEHSEINTLRALEAAGTGRSVLASATIYCSAEPCPMCAGAIFESGIGRVVYGFSLNAVLRLRREQGEKGLSLSCRAVLQSADHPPGIIGPCLEDEASAAHREYWTRPMRESH
ncbi:nucleoside deaminase [Pseudoroseomonas globiformis]|uniref:Nucleoside deaminase n=1 Tax=Teichococcus globiformis TaxID=2307229 RepID=A0ABV7G4S0_9PROT